MPLERLSIELTRRCDKACSFCYNGSHRDGDTRWTAREVVDFVTDCARAGTRAVSFGGGEPLQYPDTLRVLRELDGVVFRSMTTNGLLLKDELIDALVEARPDKVHVSVHFPHNMVEVQRVARQVRELEARGLRSGVNFLVARSRLAEATQAAAWLREQGIANERIVYLPMRGADTPTPREVGAVAGNQPFQSMTCISHCHASPRFCAIGWDRRVGWCSYTTERRELPSLTADGLRRALDGLGLVDCSRPRGIPIVAMESVE